MNFTSRIIYVKPSDIISDIQLTKLNTFSYNFDKSKYIFGKQENVIKKKKRDYYYYLYFISKIKDSLYETDDILYIQNNIENPRAFIAAITKFFPKTNVITISPKLVNSSNFIKEIKTYVQKKIGDRKIGTIFIPNTFYEYKNIYLREYQFVEKFLKYCVILLSLQKKNGTTILSLPSTKRNITFEIIRFISQYYNTTDFFLKRLKEIYNFKIQNKVIVYSQFKKLNDHEINEAINIILNILKYVNPDKMIHSIFKWNNKIPEKLNRNFIEVNDYFEKKHQNLIKINEIIKRKNDTNYTKELIQGKKDYQIYYAIKWCINNCIPIDIYYSLFWKSTKELSKEEKIIKAPKFYIKKKYIFPFKQGVNLDNLLITKSGLYSITPSIDAHKMAKLLFYIFNNNHDITITDATSGVGGNTIQFAFFFNKINAIDISKVHCKILKNNIDVYNLTNSVNIICDDYLQIYKNLKQDIVFFDPPWGGPNYKEFKKIPLYLGNIKIEYIIKDIFSKKIASLVAIKVPKNFDNDSFSIILCYYSIKTYYFKKFNYIIVKKI